MTRKNRNFSLGLDRKQLVAKAQTLGKTETQAKKASTKALENFIKKQNNIAPKSTANAKEVTNRKRNTNFRLGLNRKELIEASQVYGKTEKSAKKSSTVNLEKYIIRQLMGKGTKFPELSNTDKRDVSDNAEAWGVRDALRRLTYRTEKLSGKRDEENFLRLTINDSFSLYYDGQVKREHVDELISRLPQLEATQVDSDMINIGPYYRNLFIDYAEELEELEEQTNIRNK